MFCYIALAVALSLWLMIFLKWSCIQVQQPFDPTSYYAQFYRSGVDTDGRLSPFSSPGGGTKYNDSVGVLQQQGSQPSQEVCREALFLILCILMSLALIWTG